MTNELCKRCKKRPKKKHHNGKWCIQCAKDLIRRPAWRLTPKQIRLAHKLKGTMYVHDLAKEIGTSRSNLRRWAMANNININGHKYPESLVKKVCKYYEKHGKVKTIECFPNIRLRSIIEKHVGTFQPRRIPWQPEEIIFAAKVAGLVSREQLARYFDRPRANEGSITALWMKKFKIGGGNINGLTYRIAKHFISDRCPVYETNFWFTRRGGTEFGRKIVLWIDVEKHMRPGLPDHIVEAIRALAKFQRWLHGKYVKRSVNRIMKEL